MPARARSTRPLTDAQRDLAGNNRGLALYTAKKVWRRRRRPQDLEDLTQAAMIGLCEAARGFDPDHGSTFAAYACKACYRAALSEARTNGVIRVPRREKSDLARLPTQLVASLHDRPSLPNLSDDRDDLAVMLATLDPISRELVECRAAGQTHDEIGRRAGLSHDSVRLRIHKALADVRRRFGDNP
jgi:RNA polymerase sigma factor (sigma-70 family)